MRARDVRAIGFWIASSVALLIVAIVLLGVGPATLAFVAAYNVWLLTRPRMVRVLRRLRGQSLERIGYYED
jgi:hypothetical protein